jgi:hypothetical protein
MRLIWVGRETENFLMWDWTTQITLIRFNKIAFCGNRWTNVFERKPHLIRGGITMTGITVLSQKLPCLTYGVQSSALISSTVRRYVSIAISAVHRNYGQMSAPQLP